VWSDPFRQYYSRQLGRLSGNDIVRDSRDSADNADNAVRWSFREITPISFRWTGEQSQDQEQTWRLKADFFARRVKD